MKTLKMLLLLATCSLGPAAIGAEPSRPPRASLSAAVENGFMRVAFDMSRKGSLAEFRCRRFGRNLLSEGAAGRSLYRIEAVDAGGKTHRITSAQAAKSLITRDNTTVTITNRHAKPGPMTVIVTCRLDEGSALAHWRIRVENSSDLIVRKVVFPIVEVPDSAEYILFPYCDGCLIEQPGKRLGVGYRKEGTYPGNASTQIMAAGLEPDGGLYYAVHDSGGYKKTLAVRRTKTGIELSATHFPVDGPGNDYRQPYDVVLGPFQGTWYDAADIYKAWAVQQHWCERKLIERDDVPQWLKDAPLCLTYTLTGTVAAHGGDVQAAFDSLRKTARLYSQHFGLRVCTLLAAWQGRGYYIAPHYFPPFGGYERFTSLARGLREDGNRSIVFLCGGLYWTVEKKPPLQEYDDWECFRREGEPFAVVGPDGKTLITGEADKRVGRNAHLCAADERTHRMMLDICRKIQDLGVTVAQFESVGGGQPLCYSKSHGHPPGGGNYQAKGYYKLFESVLRQGQTRDKDFAVTIEEPGEYYMQVLSAYHARDNAEFTWPRSGAAERGVPLFTYLYHEYAIGYLGIGPSFSTKGRHRVGEFFHAANYVRGKMLGLSSWSPQRWPTPQELNEHQRKMMEGIAAVLRSPARKYLMLGRMLHPVPLDVPQTEVRFWSWRTKKHRTIRFPAVLQGVYEYPPAVPGELPKQPVGRGYALVNIAEQRIEFDLPLLPPSAGTTYVIRQYGKDGERELGQMGADPHTIHLGLDSCESTFIMVERASR
ncbi:MAG: hypothetical protein GXP27_19870 [Planctomycetes bacterium]|nr:hypothetical protein [Planctomycetota bacterium]